MGELKMIPQHSYEAVVFENNNSYTALNTISHQQQKLGPAQTQKYICGLSPNRTNLAAPT